MLCMAAMIQVKMLLGLFLHPLKGAGPLCLEQKTADVPKAPFVNSAMHGP